VGVVTSTDRAVEQTYQELDHAPGPSGQVERRPIDPPPARPPSGVPLARLIALAGLTAAQALEIGAGLLAAVAKRSESDNRGLDDDQVMISLDGRVVLVRTSSGGRATTSSSASAPTPASVNAVLTELAHSARRRARPVEPLLAELERAIAPATLVDLPAAARTLEEACGAIDRDGVRAELSALVRAIVGVSGANIVSGAPLRAPSIIAAGQARPVGRRADGWSRTAIRRIGAWLLSIAVLVAMVLLEFAFLREDIDADIDLLMDAGRSGSVPSVTPEPDGLPLIAPAPATAGAVTTVDLRTLDRCTPAAPCTVRVLVRLVPEAEPRTVTWVLQVVDRCSGGTATVPGGSVVIAPGEEQATAVGLVQLAQAASAVFAVTERPAIAASPPVLVGSCPSAHTAG